MCYSIDKNDWERFQQAMFATFMVTDGDPKHLIPGRRIALHLDELLDVVADWDVNFFRPKGLVMRMDMPGEEKYGLDFMDLYYRYHIINASGIGGREGLIEEYKKRKPVEKRQRYIDRARGRRYCSTRIVLDPVEVLQSKEMSDARGWTAWITMCKEARRRPLPPLNPNQPFNGDQRLRVRARKDRYPPSKHFYYDRFRGRENHIKQAHYPKNSHGVEDRYGHVEYYGHSNDCKWIPDEDSMDQRYGGALYRCTILPADDRPYIVVEDGHPVASPAS